MRIFPSDLTCPSCGGSFKFHILSNEIRCTSCGEVSSIPINGALNKFNLNKDLSEYPKFDLYEFEHVVECSGCGSKVLVPKNTSSVSCSYCGASSFLLKDKSHYIKPEGIIPFEITYDKASSIFNNWIKTLPDAKVNLKKLYKLKELSSIYFHYWNYDCIINCNYKALGGEVYFQDVGDQNKVHKERFVNWNNQDGNMKVRFEGVTISADKNRKDFIHNLELFDLHKLRPFHTAYLNGFGSMIYTEEPLPCFEYAKKKINNALIKAINKRILANFREAQVQNLNVQYKDVKFIPVLLPFWVGKYQFEGKDYDFIINGENGLIDGDFPISKVKSSFLSIGNNLKNQSLDYIKDRIPKGFRK